MDGLMIEGTSVKTLIEACEEYYRSKSKSWAYVTGSIGDSPLVDAGSIEGVGSVTVSNKVIYILMLQTPNWDLSGSGVVFDLTIEKYNRSFVLKTDVWIINQNIKIMWDYYSNILFNSSTPGSIAYLNYRGIKLTF